MTNRTNPKFKILRKKKRGEKDRGSKRTEIAAALGGAAVGVSGGDVLEADLAGEDVVAESAEAGHGGVAGGGADDAAVGVLPGGLAAGALVLDEDVRRPRLPARHLLLPLQTPLLRLRRLLLPPLPIRRRRRSLRPGLPPVADGENPAGEVAFRAVRQSRRLGKGDGVRVIARSWSYSILSVYYSLRPMGLFHRGPMEAHGLYLGPRI